MLLLLCRGSAQFPPPNPCAFIYESLDFDGDLRPDLEWMEAQGCGFEFKTLTLAPGTSFWRSVDTNRIPWGAPVGSPEGHDFQSLSEYAPVNFGTGANVFAITVQDPGGGQRHGWIQRPTLYDSLSRAEFARGTNEPMGLGLPGSPRWLPRLSSGQEELAEPNVNQGDGVLLSLQRRDSGFNLGVVALAAATNGTLYGIGHSSLDSKWIAHLFSVNPDGSHFQTLAHLSTNTGAQPDYGLTMTTKGYLFVHPSSGVLRRYDTTTGALKRFSTYPALRAPLRELSDGNLYSTTSFALVVLNPIGESIRVLSLGNHGLWSLESGVVEGPDGWIYLMAKSGGEGNAGGILRCRKDGTSCTVWFPFAALAGSPQDHLPSTKFLEAAVKSPLCLARDGNFYGTVSDGVDNLVYRVTPDARPSIVHFNHLTGRPALVFTNGLGGRTWEGSSLHVLWGGFTEGDDGHLYGVALPAFHWFQPSMPPAVVRIQVPDGALETLSQDSFLQSGPWVRGAEGVLYAGTRQGIASFLPGKNGVRPVCRTDSVQWNPSPLGTPLRDGQGGYHAVVPFGGAFQEGFVASVNGDGTQGRILHSFSGGRGDVLRPSGFLVAGDGDWIYGTSHQGDSYEFAPQLWRMHRETGEIEILATLPGREDGRPTLTYGLMRGRNGFFYGTTPYGGAADLGTLYRYDPVQNQITVLHEFGVSPGDQWQPWPELLEGTDGWIYGLGTGENVGPGSADGWFRIAADGSEYRILERLDRPLGSELKITGGLTEASDHRFYWVRGISSMPISTARVTGQILRGTLLEAGSGHLDVVFESAVGKEPFLWPVGRLIELPSGQFVGLGCSQWTAVYSLDPATGDVRRVHRWGMRGTGRSLASTGRFAGAVLESDGSLVVPARDAIVRLNISSTPVPEAIPDASVPASYGSSAGNVDSTLFFRSSFYLSGARDLPAGVQFSGPSDFNSFGYLSGSYMESGRITSEVYTTDGTWPGTVITNRVVFDVRPAPLKLKGPKATWITGEPTALPAGIVEGLIWQDMQRVVIGWKPESGPADHAGTYRLVPDIQDPEGRLRNYDVTVVEGSLVVVDRETRVVRDGGATYLEFPPLPDHRFVVSEATSLLGPWNPIHNTQGSATRVNRFRLVPPADGRERFYRIEVTY